MRGYTISQVHDVVVVGGGVGGLTAGTYLGRFRRPALIVDAGASRAKWIPESHNVPGFPEGISGEALLERLRLQAQSYGAEIVSGHVESVSRLDEGFAIRVADHTIRTRFLVLATGVEDRLPSIAGAKDALLRSVLRVCPICDGFEASHKRIAVIGDGEHGEREAHFLRTYSSDVAYLDLGAAPDPERRGRLGQFGIELIETSLDKLTIGSTALYLRQPDRATRSFDVCYAALGCRPRTGLIVALGAACDDSNAIRVNEHQMTSLDGLYAVGDMVKGLDQIVIAAAEAVMAATDIHNRLRQAGR